VKYLGVLFLKSSTKGMYFSACFISIRENNIVELILWLI